MTVNKVFVLLICCLLLALGGSLVFNSLLYSQAKKYYREVNETRLDPIGLKRYPHASTQVTTSNQSVILLLGDSRAEGWTTPDLTAINPNALVINRGISSQTSTQVLQRFDAHVRPLNPSVVVLQVGINDLKTIGLFPGRKEEIIADCKAHIQKLVEQSTDLGATVIITTIFPVGEVPLQRKPFWSDDIEAAITEVNGAIATLASADEAVVLLDSFSLLADEQGKLRSDYSQDELHLTPAAYETLNQALIATLKQL